jgi:hypothetical protein
LIVGIDFDGVTHPEPCSNAQLFCQAQLLSDTLEEFPEAKPLITSNWRHDHTAQQIYDLLPSSLASRIVGCLPDYTKSGITDHPLLQYPREFEMMLWLEQSGHVGEEWLALDDWVAGFSPGLPNLIVCDPLTGLTEATMRMLRARLRLARDRISLPTWR